MIKTLQLVKEYKGSTALNGINLQVDRGDLFGFIGPNGAGKTTTMKILATLLEPTSGEAEVGGHSIWGDKRKIRSLLGYMPDKFGVYPDMRVDEYLHFFASAYKVPRRERGKVVDDLLALTDLTYKRASMVDALSRGMQQRLGLARTLVHDPQVLILDEPASGLDPRARVEIREVLRTLQDMGKTILLSSHILSELGEICNRVAILERGELVRQGTIEELAQEAQERASVLLRTGDQAAARKLLEAHPGVAAVGEDDEAGMLILELSNPQTSVGFVTEALVLGGVEVLFLSRRESSLEEVFLKLTEGLVQ